MSDGLDAIFAEMGGEEKKKKEEKEEEPEKSVDIPLIEEVKEAVDKSIKETEAALIKAQAKEVEEAPIEEGKSEETAIFPDAELDETTEEPATETATEPASKSVEEVMAEMGEVEEVTEKEIKTKQTQLAGLITEEGAEALVRQEKGLSPKQLLEKAKKETTIAEFMGETTEEEDFDTSDAVPNPIITMMIYGDKGDGKTTAAFSLPGKHYCLSFDEMSVYVWEEVFRKDGRIKVKDAMRYISKLDGAMWLESADRSFRYINHLFDVDVEEFEPDWIVVDGLDILVRDICEKRMRYALNLDPIKPFNLLFWQLRNMYADQIHLRATKIAKRGVIYTAYVNEEGIEFVDGKMIKKKRRPQWAAEVKKKVAVVILVERDETETETAFKGRIDSSKIKGAKTGTRGDITWDEEKQEGGLNKITNFGDSK